MVGVVGAFLKWWGSNSRTQSKCSTVQPHWKDGQSPSDSRKHCVCMTLAVDRETPQRREKSEPSRLEEWAMWHVTENWVASWCLLISKLMRKINNYKSNWGSLLGLCRVISSLFWRNERKLAKRSQEIKCYGTVLDVTVHTCNPRGWGWGGVCLEFQVSLGYIVKIVSKEKERGEEEVKEEQEGGERRRMRMFIVLGMQLGARHMLTMLKTLGSSPRISK